MSVAQRIQRDWDGGFDRGKGARMDGIGGAGIVGAGVEEEMREVDEVLGGRVVQSWDVRVKALKKLRMIAGYEGVRLGDERVGDRGKFVEALRRMGPGICAQIGDLRSVVVRETCACVGFLAETLGDVFAECCGDLIMPALLKISAVTIAVISSSSMEAARKILSFSRNGLSVFVVEQLADAVKNKKEPPMRRVAAAEYIGLLLVDPDDYQALNAIADIVEEAIGSGCVDPVERVRATSRSSWRKLEASLPQRAANFLDTLPPQVRSLILQEKNFEMEAGVLPIMHPRYQVPPQSASYAPRRVQPLLPSPDNASTCSTTSTNEDVMRTRMGVVRQSNRKPSRPLGDRRPRRSMAFLPRSHSQDAKNFRTTTSSDHSRPKPSRARRVTLAPSAFKQTSKKQQQRPRRPPRRSIFASAQVLKEINETEVQNRGPSQRQDTIKENKKLPMVLELTNSPSPLKKLPSASREDSPKLSEPIQTDTSLTPVSEISQASPSLQSGPVSPNEEQTPVPHFPPVSPDPPTPAPNGPRKCRLSFLLDDHPSYMPNVHTHESQSLPQDRVAQYINQAHNEYSQAPEDELKASAESADVDVEEESLSSIAEAMLQISMTPDVNSSTSTIETADPAELGSLATAIVQSQPAGVKEAPVEGNASTISLSEKIPITKSTKLNKEALSTLRDAVQRIELAKGWDDRVKSLKRVSEACKGLSGCDIDYNLARKTVMVIGECIGESHFRVAAAALDSMFDLLLNIEAGIDSNGEKVNALQLALEKHWGVLYKILMRLGDGKEHIRAAADRALHALAVQFDPEVRVLLVLRAVNAGARTLTKPVSSQANQKSRPKLMMGALETISSAFTSAKASGDGFMWHQKALEGLLGMIAPLLKDRRVELRNLATRVALQVNETAPKRTLELASRNINASYRVALMDALDPSNGRPRKRMVDPGLPRRRSRMYVAPRGLSSGTQSFHSMKRADSYHSLMSSLSGNSN